MNKIKAIIVITDCANFKDGGILCITNEFTSTPLKEVLDKIEKGLENRHNLIKIPHRNEEEYSIIVPKFIVGYDVFYK